MTETPRGVADLEGFEAVFGALAHRTRRMILVVLNARGGQMTSGEIASRFDCAWPTTTRHLRLLEQAGLVRVETKGRERVYVFDLERLQAVAGGWLARFPVPGDADVGPGRPPRREAAGGGRDRTSR